MTTIDAIRLDVEGLSTSALDKVSGGFWPLQAIFGGKDGLVDGGIFSLANGVIGKLGNALNVGGQTTD